MSVATLEKTCNRDTFSLIVDLTSACNLRCPYCYYGEHDKPERTSPELVLGSVRNLTGMIGENNRLNLWFMGGEPLVDFPLLRETVHAVANLCAKKGWEFEWGATSNITLLNKEIRDFFVANGGSIHCSIDGDIAAQEINRPYKEGRYDLQQFTDNIKLALSISPYDTARMTVSPGTASLLYEGVCQLAKWGFKSIYFGPAVHPRMRWDESVFSEISTQCASLADGRDNAILDEVESIDPLDRYMALATDRSVIPEASVSIGCGAAFNMLAMDVNGRLWPCHRFTNGHFPELEVKQPIDDIESALDYIRRDIPGSFPHECDDCEIKAVCRLSCWAEHRYETETPGLISATSCRFQQAIGRGAMSADSTERRIRHPFPVFAEICCQVADCCFAKYVCCRVDCCSKKR